MSGPRAHGAGHRRRVVVVGGAGDVGVLILPALAAEHIVRVADLRRPAEHDGEFVRADVTDYATLLAATQHQDALIYLAMGSRQGWGDPAWAASQFDVNVKGLYLTLRAANEQGIRHVVYASTLSVFEDCLRGDHAVDAQPDAVDAYGLSKYFGEQVCAAAVRRGDMTAISLRLITPLSDDEWMAYGEEPDCTVATAGSDVARAFLAALDFPPSARFEAPLITGDHRRRYLDWGLAESLLTWRPLARRADAVAEGGHDILMPSAAEMPLPRHHESGT